MLRCSLITEPSDLVALAGQWSELVAASARSEPCQSPAWLLPWWDVFGPFGGRELRVLVVRHNERLIGLAPLLLRKVRYRKAIAFRRLELMGSGEDEADEIVSDYNGIVAAAGWEKPVADAFASALTSKRLGPWDELVLPRMDGESSFSTAVVEALRFRGATCSIDSSDECRYITLPATWDEYLASLSSSRRYKVKRSLRDVDKWAGGEWKVHRVTSSDEIVDGFDILMRLHGERWGEDGGLGVFASPFFRRFHKRAMLQLFKRGALDLSWLAVRGEPVAVNYSIVWDRKLHFYQSGRKVDVPGKVTPGIALHALSIKHSIENGLREYDFLGGEARYKTMLATHTRPLVDIRVTPLASVRETARGITESGVHALKRARERLRSRNDIAIKAVASRRVAGR